MQQYAFILRFVFPGAQAGGRGNVYLEEAYVMALAETQEGKPNPPAHFQTLLQVIWPSLKTRGIKVHFSYNEANVTYGCVVLLQNNEELKPSIYHI